MPTDPSINLATSAAAAFCARLCVHPLDHLRASLQHVESTPKGKGIRPRLDHLLTTIRYHLHTLHTRRHHQQHNNQYKKRLPHHTTFREQISLWRGLYHGVPLALIINVPALAFFLSTYDATKHGITFLSSRMQLSFFQLHHFETHLISGMMAKVAGTILWAPMAKLVSVQGHTHGQLSLQEAILLVKKVCRSTTAGSGTGGVWSLWSGYRAALTSLLPYTMLYFATYEKLKQFARRIIITREHQQQQQQQQQQGGLSTTSTTTTRVIDYRTDHRPLDLGTYMVCVAGAVAISSTVCHTASTLRVYAKDRWTSYSASSILSKIPVTPASTSASASAFRTSGSIMTAKVPAPALVNSPQQHHSHLGASPAYATQHANMTTTSSTESVCSSTRRPLASTASGSEVVQQRKQSGRGLGLLRRIGRGLGPRVMWTAPGVTLTTAGFEVFRNLALGVV